MVQDYVENRILPLNRAGVEGKVIAQLVLHAEPHLLDRSKGALQAILEEVAGDGSAWIATLGQVAHRWKEAVGDE